MTGVGSPPPWAVPALAAASLVYGAAARLHRRVAAWTAPGRGRPACAVLSVGGLTVGGAGKTPVAARLALALHRRGWRVVLASGGYRGRPRRRVELVSDGRQVHGRVETSGDEPFVLAAHAPGVPVLVGRDRRIVAHHAVSLFDADLVVLDDGFQHHRLARDLDVVCIDGVGAFGNGHVLPWGPLREPLSALRAADWLCIVDGPEDTGEQPTLPRAVRRWLEAGRPVLRARRVADALVALERGERCGVERLAGERVGLIAGVARPESVRRTLDGLGARVVRERLFRDHHVYRAEDLRGLEADVDRWVTTEKDALKILPAWLEGRPLWVLEIGVGIEDEKAALDRLEQALRARRRARPGGRRRRRVVGGDVVGGVERAVG